MTDYQDQHNALMSSSIEEEEPLSMSLSGIGRSDVIPGDNIYENSASTGSGGILSQTTLIIVAVAIVAAGSLYLMRATQGNLKDSKEQKEIAAKIADTLNRLSSKSLLADGDPLHSDNLSALLTPTDEITDIFEQDVRNQQVPIEQVKKDPFALSVGETSNQIASVNNAADELDRRLSKYRDELRKLELQSIMLGTRNIAVIGGEFYKKGDHLGSFTITDIDKLTVYLEAAGSPFELTLQDQGR